MSKILIVFAVALTLFSCSKSDRRTGSELPAGIRQAINAYTGCTCDPYIKLYTWRAQAVYVQYILGPLCNGVPMYYNQNGETLPMPAGYTLDQFLAEAQFVKTVWECNPSHSGSAQ